MDLGHRVFKQGVGCRAKVRRMHPVGQGGQFGAGGRRLPLGLQNSGFSSARGQIGLAPLLKEY